MRRVRDALDLAIAKASDIHDASQPLNASSRFFIGDSVVAVRNEI